MSRSVFCFFSLLSVLVGVHSPQVAQAQTPKLVIENPVVDFGSVPQGTRVDLSYRLRNAGTGALEIKAVQPACGCTTAQSSIPSIAPGETTVLAANFDSTGFRGKKVKTIRIYTNDPQTPSALLSFQGNIEQEIDVEPVRAFFGDVAKGTEKSVDLRVQVNDQNPIQILEILPRSENIRAELIGDGSKKSLRVTLKGTTPAGIFRSRITLKTSSAQLPTFTVPVFAKVIGELSLEPSDISFGLQESPLKEDLVKTVVLQNSSKNAVSVLAIESENPNIRAEAGTTTGNKTPLRIIAAAGSVGTLKSRLKILTNHPDVDQRELLLPVFGILTRKGS